MIGRCVLLLLVIVCGLLLVVVVRRVLFVCVAYCLFDGGWLVLYVICLYSFLGC